MYLSYLIARPVYHLPFGLESTLRSEQGCLYTSAMTSMTAHCEGRSFNFLSDHGTNVVLVHSQSTKMTYLFRIQPGSHASTSSRPPLSRLAFMRPFKHRDYKFLSSFGVKVNLGQPYCKNSQRYEVISAVEICCISLPTSGISLDPFPRF